MAILLPDNDFQSIRLKNRYFWRKFLFNASGLLSVFMWLHFGHVLMLENLFYKFGTASPQPLSDAWLRDMEVQDGCLEQLCPSSEPDHPSCLFISRCLGFLPKIRQRVMLWNLLRDTMKNCPMTSHGGLPGLCSRSLPLVCRPEVTILELSVKKSVFPLGHKTWFSVPLSPNTQIWRYIHTLSVFRKLVSSFSYSCYKVVESQIVIL